MARQERSDRPRRTTYRAPQRPWWQSPLVLVTGAAVLVAIVVIVVNGLPKAKTTGELIVPQTSYPANLTEGEKLGSATAPVVMEIYSDFQCPFCARLVKEQLGRYIADFVTPGTLRIEAKDIDILGGGASTDNESLDLAVGARCAGEQDRYWQFHDVAFWNQQTENTGANTPAFIARIADAAGVDRTKWDACIARDDVRQAVIDTTKASRQLGISSTPTLRINGQLVRAGVPDYDSVAAGIRALAAAASPGATLLTPVPSTAP